MSKHRLAMELLDSLNDDRPAPRRGAPQVAVQPNRRSVDPARQAQILEMRRVAKEFEPGEDVVAHAERRKNKRFVDPVLRVLVGSKIYTTKNWSIGGALLNDWDNVTLKAKDSMKVSMTEAADGTYFCAQARIVRIDRKSKTASLHFTHLAKGGFEWLSGLQLQQRGRSTVVQPDRRVAPRLFGMFG